MLSIGRSSLYYTPKGESPETLALVRRIDELFLKYPFYGARQMVRVNGGAKLVHPGGAKLVHLMLCGTRCWGVVPVVHRRDPRCFV